MNATVKVRLTTLGERIFKSYKYKLTGEMREIPVDEEGFYSDQMWCLFAMFGEHVSLGGDNPFETIIYFKGEDLESKN